MDDYEVGYGKPPQHSRFKPGQSGNPRGRPKGARNAATVLRDELAEKITVTENGKTITITKLEGIVKAAVVKALKGDPRALNPTYDFLDKILGNPFLDPDAVVNFTLVFPEEEERRREIEASNRKFNSQRDEQE